MIELKVAQAFHFPRLRPGSRQCRLREGWLNDTASRTCLVNRLVKGTAARKALGGVLRQRAGNDGTFRFGQRAQVRLFLHVLLRELANVFAVERAMAGQELLVNDGQTVLVAVFGNFARER